MRYPHIPKPLGRYLFKPILAPIMLTTAPAMVAIVLVAFIMLKVPLDVL